VNRLKLLDRQFGAFLASLEEIPGVTLVVFGDHQPIFIRPGDLSLSRTFATGTQGLDDALATLAPHAVPITLWRSAGAPVKPRPPIQGAFCLSGDLLDLAGVSRSAYYLALGEHCQRQPVLLPGLDLTGGEEAARSFFRAMAWLRLFGGSAGTHR
jgi:hypothetical protein